MNSKIMNMMNNWFNNIRIYHLLIDRFNGGWLDEAHDKGLKIEETA